MTRIRRPQQIRIAVLDLFRAGWSMSGIDLFLGLPKGESERVIRKTWRMEVGRRP